MQPLERSLRRELERTIQQAREIAEAAARTALTQLGVGEAKAYDYLSDAQRDLRRRLRVHGRQLGDELKVTGAQETERLLEEVAYEHWHRMLFARFLAENNLLMYPDPQHPVPVTLAECEELAPDEGAKNGWELAARFASQMLPQIFRQDSPVLELTLPPENQQRLESLLAKLPAETFIASDALGWVYQFWQAKKKDEVNASEVKIGARELPAVTQLFTEPYMVSFLLDNSLGAWWAARRLTDDDLQNAETEAELRHKASISGVPLEYLRFVRDEETGKWTPAAGTLDAWPQNLSELKTLDPCCGSGHFLVSALLMLAPMRAELENLTPREACDAVLRDNLHGLELDQRCVEIAAFALALTAWRYAGYRTLPDLQLACSGLSVKAARSEWKSLASGKKNLEFGLNRLYEVFENAPVLGSLINPARMESNLIVKWDEVRDAFEQALAQEPEDERHAAGVVAQGMAKAAALLADKYHWVITNVPYLARGKQDQTLLDFIELHHNEGKSDLATAFLDRCLDFCIQGGTTSIVLPQNWLFLTSYTRFRKKLLQNERWHLIARLGEGGFDSSAAAGAFIILISISRGTSSVSGGLFGEVQSQLVRGLDASQPQTAQEKAALLLIGEVQSALQSDQLKNPDVRVSFAKRDAGTHIEQLAECYQGIVTGDIERFTKRMWEVNLSTGDWQPFRRSNNTENAYGDLSTALRWERGQGSLHKYAREAREQLHDMHESGNRAWGKLGVAINRMRDLHAVPYYGEQFDNNVAVVFPKIKSAKLTTLLAFFESSEFTELVRDIDQSIKVTNQTLLKVPFDNEHWEKIADLKYPKGFPNPYSDDSTQWAFHGHPMQSDDPLQVAVARLLGYRWPAELDKKMELSDEARAWVKKCDELLPYADRDGVVCIPPVRGERPGAERLLNLLATAYGDSWNNDVLSQLLASADHTGKSLETWLRDKFFTQHCALFGQRPFIWHLWDGLRDGFSVLVNYHKLDYKLLETLIYNYLGDWITRQKQDVVQKVDGAQEKLSAAETLQKRLILILKGEAPYDIFVRWKPLHEQPIGWQPDINDGVRLNIRPFMSVPDVGKKGAGVLRDKPKIDWGKDRGKDVEYSFWYPLFKGDRINDHHLTLAEKQAGRDKKRETD